MHRTGGPSVLKYEEVPLPKPGRGKFLIEVHYAGVNPVDTKIRRGKFKMYHAHLPAIIGRDLAGIVRARGPKSKRGRPRFMVGDDVFGLLDYDCGAYAEYAVASARDLAHRPEKVPERQAGAIGVAALTAWQCLFDHGRLKRGQRVLIHGAAGGVGHFAVQFAKLAGATVIATASERDLAWVAKLGADEVIDFRNQRFEEHTGKIDLVVDLVSGETQERSWSVLKPSGGALVSTLSEPSRIEARRHKARAVRMVVKTKSDQLAKIASLIGAGKVKVEIAKVFPLKKAGAAHAYLEKEHVRGKIVLEMSPRWFDLDGRFNESTGTPSEENAIYARANIPGVSPFA
jgi:NADPH:quinone reductase-like Zn-dependent oxidoreductase